MKKITKIEYQKNNKNRVNIYIDDNFAFGLDLNIMIKYSLAKNMEIEEEFINDILKAEEEINVYNYAVSILSRSAKSEKELRMKLQDKGYENQFIDNAIIKLKQQRYLDDERYSEMFINDKINFSKYGKRRIQEGLYIKGVDKEIISEKISQLSEEDEFERAMLLGAKKIKSIKDEDTHKKGVKLSNFLIGKGFEYSVVRKVVSRLIKGDMDELDFYL